MVVQIEVLKGPLDLRYVAGVVETWWWVVGKSE